MKKFVKIISLLMTVITLFSLLASCSSCKKTEHSSDDPFVKMTTEEKINYLFDQYKNQFNKSYKADISETCSITSTVADQTIESTLEMAGSHTVISPQGENFSYLEKSSAKSVTKTNGTVTDKEEYDLLEGYANRTMFYSYVPKGVSDKPVYFKSEVSLDNMKTYLKDKEEYGSLDINYSTAFNSIDFAEDHGNGQYVLSFKDIKNSAKSSIYNWCKNTAGLYDTEFYISDYSVNHIVNSADNTLKSIKEELVIKVSLVTENDMTMVITSERIFSVPDENIDLTPENSEKYTKSGDLRYLFYIEKATQELSCLNNNSFKYTSKISLTSEKLQSIERSEYEERGTVKYGTKHGKFVFQIKSVLGPNIDNRKNLELVYNGATSTTKLTGNTPTENIMSEAEAKGFILENFIDHLAFERKKATYLYSLEGDTVTVKIQFNDTSLIEKIFEENNIKTNKGLKNVDLDYTAVFNSENKLISLNFTMKATCEYKSSTHTAYQHWVIYDFSDPDLSNIDVTQPEASPEDAV